MQDAEMKPTPSFIEALQADFDKHGASVIEALREKYPAKYMQLVDRLLPKPSGGKKEVAEITREHIEAIIERGRAPNEDR
jgi:hypothetical protein